MSTQYDEKDQKYVGERSGEKRKLESTALVEVHHADNALLAELGYTSEFKVRPVCIWLL
jgi:hypothetical protein